MRKDAQLNLRDSGKRVLTYQLDTEVLLCGKTLDGHAVKDS